MSVDSLLNYTLNEKKKKHKDYVRKSSITTCKIVYVEQLCNDYNVQSFVENYRAKIYPSDFSRRER